MKLKEIYGDISFDDMREAIMSDIVDRVNKDPIAQLRDITARVVQYDDDDGDTIILSHPGDPEGRDLAGASGLDIYPDKKTGEPVIHSRLSWHDKRYFRMRKDGTYNYDKLIRYMVDSYVGSEQVNGRMPKDS